MTYWQKILSLFSRPYSINCVQVVSIHPAEGHVGPGKSAPCRITFYSHSSPATYDLDITCKVYKHIHDCVYLDIKYKVAHIYTCTHCLVCKYHAWAHQVVDEYEVSEYKCHLEQWRAQQEETKHIFTISHPTQGGHHLTTSEVWYIHTNSHTHMRAACNTQNVCIHVYTWVACPQDTLKQELSAVHTRSLSNSDLRGSRYQVLPPIGAHSPDISYDDWKKL